MSGLATEILFGRLDGDVSEQELNLVQLAAGKVALAGAGGPQVVRGKFWNIGSRGRGFHNFPKHLRSHTIAPRPAHLLIDRKRAPNEPNSALRPSIVLNGEVEQALT